MGVDKKEDSLGTKKYYTTFVNCEILLEPYLIASSVCSSEDRRQTKNGRRNNHYHYRGHSSRIMYYRRLSISRDLYLYANDIWVHLFGILLNLLLTNARCAAIYLIQWASFNFWKIKQNSRYRPLLQSETESVNKISRLLHLISYLR